MITNSRSDYDSEPLVWDANQRRKAFAVGILSQAWAGARFPRPMIWEALRIRRRMLQEGTWESA